ncbi:organic cation transporter protein-like [Brevipalpus obovatus]|uniref:organic cation transporter protein-like n=1 Tax=Brevipalpus obovatus TaxID=246614 RepID=UPI003D9EB59C
MVESKTINISDILGNWGPWQTNIFIFYFTSLAFSVFDKLSMPFFAPPIDYWCSEPLIYKNSSKLCSSNCEVWTYDKSFYSATIIDKWNLICDRSWLASFAQSCFMGGVIVGAVIFSQLSDKFGRLTVLRIAIPMEIFASVGVGLAPTISSFIFFKFLSGVACNGRALTGYLLLLECIGKRERGFTSVAVDGGFAFGYMILPGIYYLIRNYQIFSYFCAALEVIWLIWLATIPESIRWMMTNGKIKEAEAELIRACKMNSRSVDDVVSKFALLKKQIESESDSGVQARATFFDLIRSDVLRRYSAILYFSFFVNAFVYYGLSLNIGDLNGNLFLNFFFAGLVEVPSYYITAVALNHFDRKTLLKYFMMGAGLSCLSTVLFLSPETTNLRVFLAMVGKFCVTSSFTLCYVFSSEIYPTVLRQTGIASCSIAARAGCILAPFVKELTASTSLGFSLSIFGSLALINSALVLFLPETRGIEMPSDVEDAEKMFSKNLKSRPYSGDKQSA